MFKSHPETGAAVHIQVVIHLTALTIVFSSLSVAVPMVYVVSWSWICDLVLCIILV